eukprot:358367-Chlamydomonas_euryale.AAC.1
MQMRVYTFGGRRFEVTVCRKAGVRKQCPRQYQYQCQCESSSISISVTAAVNVAVHGGNGVVGARGCGGASPSSS